MATRRRPLALELRDKRHHENISDELADFLPQEKVAYESGASNHAIPWPAIIGTGSRPQWIGRTGASSVL